jgi:hypothetical protein
LQCVIQGAIGLLPTPVFRGSSKDDIAKLLADNYLSPTPIVLQQNAVVVNTGSHLVLFDTGIVDRIAFIEDG